ncbi:MAG TPA: pitrilysin family protein [Kiritimatiellia bacterium]|nr:pitrilysin family protein [Kiritimatiellia bacterium]
MKLNTQETRLDNGLRIVSSHMPHAASVAMGIWVGVGGRYENQSMQGMSHFLEHLLFKGTETRSARAISQEIEGRGGYLNAFTQEEATCYYARIGAKYVWPMANVLADMYLHPRFAPSDIEKERGVIIEEIMMYRDQPQQVAEDLLGEMVWEKHPLGRPLIGTPKHILGYSRDDIAGFKRSKYCPANTVIALAGCVDHEAAVRRIAPLFEGLSAVRRPACRAVEPATPQRPFAQIEKKIEQSHLALALRLFGREDKRRYALKLLSVMLGENMSSRLFQVVRERHGMAYSVHSSVHLFSDTGVLSVTAGLDRKKTAKAIALILKELDAMRRQEVSARELRRAKDYSIGQLQLSMESSSSQMMWIGGQILQRGCYEQPEEIIRKLEAVSAADVLRLAREIIRASHFSLALVCPEGGAADPGWIKTETARLG